MTSGARVLIVDDDAPARRLLQVRLRALGCEVALAADGEQALAEIKKYEPALMLLDLQMPKMGGMEVLRHLRSIGTLFPVVVITAHGSIESAVAAMKEGAYDFVTKPLDANHFDIVVRKALESETLKRRWELLAEETDNRHRLIVGRSKPMTDAVDMARKAAASSCHGVAVGRKRHGQGDLCPRDSPLERAHQPALCGDQLRRLDQRTLGKRTVRP